MASISGGAVGILKNSNINIQLLNVIFVSNSASSFGGALYSDLSTEISFINVTFK
jgi:predicted outer membrane repeat protein